MTEYVSEAEECPSLARCPFGRMDACQAKRTQEKGIGEVCQ